MWATAEKVVPRSIPTALRLLMCFLEALWIRCLVCEATQCSFRASSFNPERLFFSAPPSPRRDTELLEALRDHFFRAEHAIVPGKAAL